MSAEGLGLWTPKVKTWEVFLTDGASMSVEAPSLTIDGGALVFRQQDGAPIRAIASWASVYAVTDEDDE